MTRRLILLLVLFAVPVAAQHSLVDTRLTAQGQKPPFGARIDPSRPFSEGLLAMWTFAEGGGATLYDVSGFGRHGTLGAMDNSDWVATERGMALDFDGSTEYVDTGISWSTSDTSLTICAWIRSTGASGVDRIVSNYAGSGPDFLAIYLINGDLGAFFRDSSDNTINPSHGATVNDDVWHHVAVVLDGTVGQVYADGAPGTSDTNASFNGSMDSGQTVAIGRDSGSSSSSYFPGLITAVVIHNRALTSAEVVQQYADSYAAVARSELIVAHVAAGAPPTGQPILKRWEGTPFGPGRTLGGVR